MGLWKHAENGLQVSKSGLSEDELTRYQPWFDNARRLKELVARLESLSVHAFDAERQRKAPAASKSRASRRGPRPG